MSTDQHSAQSCYDAAMERLEGIIPDTNRLEGEYLINLQGGQIQRKYPTDSANPPKYGYRFHSRYLRRINNNVQQDEPNHPSVNCSDCCGCSECSLLLQQNVGSTKPEHLGIVDLAKLNAHQDMVYVFEAIPEPIPKCTRSEHPGNPCHYELKSSTATVRAVQNFCALFKDNAYSEYDSEDGKQYCLDLDECVSFQRDIRVSWP